MIETSAVRLAGVSWSAAHASISHPGKGHDRVLCLDGFLGVADGATPLGAGWPDAGIFAQTALESLREAAARGDASVRELWGTAIAETAARVRVPQPFASCSAAIVRELGTTVEISVLGDCTAIIELADRRVRLHDPAVQLLDAQVARAETPNRAEMLLANRGRMNTAAGYWIFATNPAAADHVRSLAVAASEVSEVLLHTDGVATAGASSVDDVLRPMRNGFRPPSGDDASFIHLRPAR